jgi:hypothetical protein
MELEILHIAQKPNKEGQHLTVTKETVVKVKKVIKYVHVR